MATTKTVYRSKIGLPPGTLVHIGKKKTDKVVISVFDYDPENLFEKKDIAPEECASLKDKATVTWINVDGLHDVEKIGKLGKAYNIHALLLEDILNTRHRPKVEFYDEHTFFTFKMIGFDKHKTQITREQVSIILGNNNVISFQERPGDIFDVIRDRIRNKKGKVREKGAGYLVYLLVDIVVDHYFIITEHISERLEELEADILDRPDEGTLGVLQDFKKDLISLRRAIYPIREAISNLSKEADEDTAKYFRDLYDHAIQVSESLETYKDMVSGLKDLYLSSISHQMNKVMQVLTIMATIFIPLTFIAGIYGMNFEVMPELKWKYGYFGVWVLMAIIFIGMLFFFKRKKWF